MTNIKKPNTSAKKDWHKLNYIVPISETFHEESMDGGFIIRGTAINATTTRNQTTYTADELRKAASSLCDKPILKDHNAIIDNIVGRTTQNIMYNESESKLDFEGQIMDEKCKQMIRDKRIKNVSVGAFVRDVEEIIDEESGESTYLVKGIEFVEISLVAVPADPNAGFAMAMAESLKIKKESEESEESEVEEEQDDDYPLQSEEGLEQEARWTGKYINSLPDAAFAVILPGGEKDDEGKTKPRSLRMLPHHNDSVKSASENSSVDLPHLRNALARLDQSKMSDAMKGKALAHLEAHARVLKVGKFAKSEQSLNQKMIINIKYKL